MTTPRTKPDSQHLRPVVLDGAVIGHVAQEPPTAGTVREWIAYATDGRRLGSAGSRALAEEIVHDAH